MPEDALYFTLPDKELYMDVMGRYAEGKSLDFREGNDDAEDDL